jgi:Domain of unknown function (DUF4396)
MENHPHHQMHKMSAEEHARHMQQMQSEHKVSENQPNRFSLALSATLHCLLGCGIGEITGVIIGTALGWDMVPTMVLAVILGIIGGFALGIIPLRNAGFPWARAFKTVLIAEGLSIAVMETAQVLTEIYTPGVMEAGLTDGLFWMGMGLAMVAGFVAAFPVNYWLIGRGITHKH